MHLTTLLLYVSSVSFLCLDYGALVAQTSSQKSITNVAVTHDTIVFPKFSNHRNCYLRKSSLFNVSILTALYSVQDSMFSIYIKGFRVTVFRKDKKILLERVQGNRVPQKVLIEFDKLHVNDLIIFDKIKGKLKNNQNTILPPISIIISKDDY